jgi:hypothetical protein
MRPLRRQRRPPGSTACVHAAGQQALAVAAQAALGAHRVEQQAAGDAARGGAQQRLRHRLADAVVEHQVIEQVDFAVGVVDVVDQRTQTS